MSEVDDERDPTRVMEGTVQNLTLKGHGKNTALKGRESEPL